MLRNLILVPTMPEHRILAPSLAAGSGDFARLELCGFGPVAAAARTAQLIAEWAPARVVLVGIAGRMHDRLALGSAHRFGQVACHGIGAGTGSGFIPAATMGWLQWPADPNDASGGIGDVVTCATEHAPAVASAGLLLTACAAAADADDVRLRRQLYPGAAAEDMEGFGVALACRLHGVPLDIVRGLSNSAGDRDTANWQVSAALEAAAMLTLAILEDDS